MDIAQILRLLLKDTIMMNRNLSLLIASIFLPALLARECHEQIMIKRLDSYTRGQLDRGIISALEQLIDTNRKQLPLPLNPDSPVPLLFERYPALKTKIAYIPLCSLPTPIIDCKIAQRVGTQKIYVKDDGQTCKEQIIPFSGNKPRKLEWLLADALRNDADAILARGGTGTNFGVAAALLAKHLGMEATLILTHQPNSYTVQRNILLMQKSGATLRIAPNVACRYAIMAMEFLHHKQETGRFPYLLPTGGSHPLGVLGFVNAVFELAKQIKESNGVLKEPDYIYAAVGNGTGGMPGNGTGSGGTITGLALGIQLAGLKSHLVAVHVEPEEKKGELLIDLKTMFYDTNALLHEADPSIPLCAFPTNFTEIKEFCGQDYGLFIKEAMAARKLLFETDGIKLDGTYTGKAFAGMLNMIEQQGLQKKSHLFWNGYCASEFENILNSELIASVPYALQKYFKEPVQPLDSKL